MQTVKRIGEWVLFGGIVFLLFLVAFEHKLHIPSWLQVAGRMHPLFLHFPIVLLLLSFVSLWLPSQEQFASFFNTIRLVAALSAVITAIMGLLLSLEDGRSGNILQWHKWTGISVAILGYIFYRFQASLLQAKITGRSFTIAAGSVILIAGHFGADLTHGEDYLLAPIKNTEKKIVPFNQAIAFNDVIKPIFEKKCISCHGEGSMKGGLLLEDTIGLLKGGKTGPLFIPGDPLMSLLMHRIHLPEDDKKHMPPISKTALTRAEIELLAAWIKSGAGLNNKLNALPAQDSFRILSASYLAPAESSPDQPVYDFVAADEKKIKELNNNYRIIEPQGIGSPALSIHFYGKNVYNTKSLEELHAIKQQVTELSLARMPVKDEDLSIVKQMINLKKLNLNYTDITAAGLAQLTGLQKLQELAISGTAVTAQSIEKIAGLPALSSIFIWNTKIDSAQASNLRTRYKKLHFETGFIDNGQVMIELSPPLIQTEAGVFDKTTDVQIKHPFKGVEIRYTIDGSVPDSVNSPLYKAPIRLNETTIISTRAFKKGWYGSSPVQSAFIKRGFKPDSIQLVSPPDQKYNGGSAILSDGQLSDVNFGNGQWLGYRSNEANVLQYFHQAVEVKSILVNILQSIDQYIFPPTILEVYGGTDKNNLKLLGSIKPTIPVKTEMPSLIQEKINFSATSVNYLKIVAQPIKVLPEWHRGKGEKGWVFISEIIAN